MKTNSSFQISDFKLFQSLEICAGVISNHWKLRCGLAAVAAAFAITGCSQKQDAVPQKKEIPPVPVAMAAATTRDVPVQLVGIGTVHAAATVSVKSQQKGELQKVAFKEGDEVKAGDLIFTIDPRPFDAALQMTRANLDRDKAQLVRAEADMKRADELLKSDSIAQSAYDQFRSAVDSQKATIAADDAAMANAQVQRDYCFIRAPISGRIGALLINQGNVVRDADTVLAVINQVKPIYVDFNLPEQNLPDIRAYQAKGALKVTSTFPQHPDIQAVGALTMINNEVDTTTGTIKLRATFENTDETLWPGQFVNVALTLELRTGVVTVPAEAVQLGQNGSFVFIAKADSTVEMRPVTTGATADRMTIIEKGLSVGEKVVTGGHLRLIPGSKYELAGTETNAAPAAAKSP